MSVQPIEKLNLLNSLLCLTLSVLIPDLNIIHFPIYMYHVIYNPTKPQKSENSPEWKFSAFTAQMMMMCTYVIAL